MNVQKVLVIEWVLFMFHIINFVTMCGYYLPQFLNSFETGSDKSLLILYPVVTVFILASLSFNILITKGVTQKKSTYCKIWNAINCVLMVLHGLNIVYAFMTLSSVMAILLSAIVHIGIILYRVYAWRCVKSFMMELRNPISSRITYN